MLLELTELHEAMAAVMQSHRTLRDAPALDHRALSQIRWQMAQISRRRMAYLTDIVFPAAQRHADTPAGAALLALQAEMPAYRQRISAFVARWPMDAILADWVRYCDEVAQVGRGVAQLMRREALMVRALEVAMADTPSRPDLGKRLAG